MKKIQKIALIATTVFASSAFAYGQFNEQNPYWQQQQQQQQVQRQQPKQQQAQRQTQSNGQWQQAQRPNTGNWQGQGQGQRQGQWQGQGQPQGQWQGQGQRQAPQAPMHAQNRVGQQPHFAVGETLPKDYRGKDHRVSYKTHGLPKPSRNQAWVEVDGRYLLVNILTNAIVQVLLGN